MVDILGSGARPGLVDHFQSALDLLAPWREDTNRWVRRAVGTSVLFWAKRSRGVAEHVSHVEVPLDFLEPMLEEWDMVAVEGVG